MPFCRVRSNENYILINSLFNYVIVNTRGYIYVFDLTGIFGTRLFCFLYIPTILLY